MTIFGGQSTIDGIPGLSLNDTHHFNLHNSTWFEHPNAATGSSPLGRMKHTAVSWLSNTDVPMMTLFAGSNAESNSPVRHLSDVYSLNLLTNVWNCVISTSETLPSAREEHTAISWRAAGSGAPLMLIFAGAERNTANTYKNDAWALDLISGEWSSTVVGTPPSQRSAHSAVLWGDTQMTIYGGGGDPPGTKPPIYTATLLARSGFLSINNTVSASSLLAKFVSHRAAYIDTAGLALRVGGQRGTASGFGNMLIVEFDCATHTIATPVATPLDSAVALRCVAPPLMGGVANACCDLVCSTGVCFNVQSPVRFELVGLRMRGNSGVSGAAVSITGSSLTKNIFLSLLHFSAFEARALVLDSVDAFEGATLTASVFESCAVAVGDGGALLIKASSSLLIENCMFNQNQALDGGGGAIAAQSSSSLTMDTTICTENRARFGGCVDATGAAQLSITSGNISNNAAVQDGGGLRAVFTPLALNLSSLNGNTAGRDGGGMHLSSAAATDITRSEFTNNSATKGVGGAFRASANSPRFEQCIFTLNHATGTGGLGYADANGNAKYQDCDFTLNFPAGTDNRSIPCVPGTSSARADASATCDSCDSASIAIAAGATACLNCTLAQQIATPDRRMCTDMTSLNKNCTPGQKVTGATACKKCELGRFAAVTVADCTECAFGTFANTTGQSACDVCPPNHVSSIGPKAIRKGAFYCNPCPRGHIPDTVKATCTQCGVGQYRWPIDSANNDTATPRCEECPSRGVTCAGGLFSLHEDAWYDKEHNPVVNKDTAMHTCFNDECCKRDLTTGLLSCNEDEGYSGPLCGACTQHDEEQLYTRSGRACMKCWKHIENIAATAGLASLVVGLAIFSAFRRTSSRIGEHGGVLRRIAFSYIQMLGVLGIFKARGTKVFNDAIGKSSEVAGGAVTKLMPIKCLLQSQSYGPFLLNMLLPVIFAALVAIILFPTTLIKRNEEERADAATARRVERARRFEAHDPSYVYEPPAHEPVVDLGRRCGSVPTKAALAVPCCRKAATEEYIDNARRRYAGRLPLAPRFRPLLNVNEHTVCGVPRALLLACGKCRVQTTEAESAAWRAAAAVHAQWLPFNPYRRIVSVMVLIMYVECIGNCLQRPRFPFKLTYLQTMISHRYSLYPTLVASTASMFNCSENIEGKYYLLSDLNQTCYEGTHVYFLAVACASTLVFCVGTPLTLATLLVYDVCACTPPTGCCAKSTTEVQEAGAEASAAVATPSALRKFCWTCRWTCARRSATPWGYRTASIRERFGLLVAGYDTERGSIVVAWEPLVVMLRKLFITLAGVCTHVRCALRSARRRRAARSPTMAAFSLPPSFFLSISSPPSPQGSMLRDPYVQVTAALAILVCSLVLQALVQPYESMLLNVLDVGSLLVLVLTQIISIIYLYLDSLDEDQLPLALDKRGLEISVTLALFIVNVAVIATLFAAWITRFGYEKLQAAALVCKRRAKTKKARVDTGGALGEAEAIEMQELHRGLESLQDMVDCRNPLQFDERGNVEDGGASAGTAVAEGRKGSPANAMDMAQLQEENALLKAQIARLKSDRRAGHFAEVDSGAAAVSGGGDVMASSPFQTLRGELDAPLPGDWSAHADDSGATYYFSEVLQVTQWTRPDAPSSRTTTQSSTHSNAPSTYGGGV